jgi:DNA-binding transcriptional LysR family regulator
VDAGSFAGAARKLGRAPSVITYSIANLEAQLGVSLFDRKSTRRVKLTDAGQTVLAEARTVANGIDGLRAKVKGLRQGLEAEVRLVLDVMLPQERVIDALRAFREEFPTVSLRLNVETLGALTELVLNRAATVGVGCTLETNIDGIERIGVGSVTLIPVAAPGHPLSAAKNPPGAGRDHVQIVLSDRSSAAPWKDAGILATRTWRVADLGTKHMLLRAGIGWGNMPEAMVRDDLDTGRLVKLDMPDSRGGVLNVEAIYRADNPPGPAAAWLIARFEAQSCPPLKRARPEAAPKSPPLSRPRRRSAGAAPPLPGAPAPRR